jgi:hypothetical protein
VIQVESFNASQMWHLQYHISIDLLKSKARGGQPELVICLSLPSLYHPGETYRVFQFIKAKLDLPLFRALERLLEFAKRPRICEMG